MGFFRGIAKNLTNARSKNFNKKTHVVNNHAKKTNVKS